MPVFELVVPGQQGRQRGQSAVQFARPEVVAGLLHIVEHRCVRYGQIRADGHEMIRRLIHGTANADTLVGFWERLLDCRSPPGPLRRLRLFGDMGLQPPPAEYAGFVVFHRSDRVPYVRHVESTGSGRCVQ